MRDAISRLNQRKKNANHVTVSLDFFIVTFDNTCEQVRNSGKIVTRNHAVILEI